MIAIVLLWPGISRHSHGPMRRERPYTNAETVDQPTPEPAHVVREVSAALNMTPIPGCNNSEFAYYVYPVDQKYTYGYIQAARADPNFEWLDPASRHSHHVAEILFLDALQKHPSRTMNPACADAFYVPVLPGLRAGFPKADFTPILKQVQASIWFKRMGQGSDHFAVDHVVEPQVREALPGIHYLAHEIKVIGRGVTPDLFSKADVLRGVGRDIVIPYPDFGAYMYTPDEDVRASWTVRDKLAIFIGSLTENSKALRTAAMKSMDGAEDAMFVNIARSKLDLDQIMPLTMRGVFGISPTGDSHSARRTYTLINCGTIPVLLCDYCELPWEWHFRYEEFMVFIPEAEVMAGNLMRILRSIPSRRIAAMQEKLLEVRHSFNFSSADTSPRSTVDLALADVALRTMPLRRYRRLSRVVVP